MSQEPTVRDHRRREARAIKWKDLIPQHRDAVRRLLELLQSAVRALPEPKRKADDPTTVSAALRVRDDRYSQLAFIDGGRGTGKTSVELSLRQALISGEEHFKAMTGGLDGDEAAIAREIRPHVQWLTPLDIEPLPAGVNVLAAILVRVEQVLQDFVSQSPNRAGWLAQDEYGDADLLGRLDTLRTQAVHAWDGGLPERSRYQSLHAWSQEVLDAERARLNLVERLTFILDRIAWHRRQRGKENTLFVLVVDDFDLSPSHCVELLRIVRMISTPRLFFIIGGDLGIAQRIMHLKAVGDASGLLRGAAPTLQCVKNTAHIAAMVASNNLRKLVPPAHRIGVGSLDVDDLSQVCLAQEPGKEGEVTFVRRLEQWTFTTAGRTQPMADAFLGPWRGDDIDIDMNGLRFFRAFLHVPVRLLVDLELTLSRLVAIHGSPNAHELAGVIADELRLRLGEQSSYETSDEDRASIEAAVRMRGTREWPSILLLQPLATWGSVGRGTQCEVHYRLVERHEWAAASDQSDQRRDLVAGLFLLHDLAVQGGEPSNVSTILRGEPLGRVEHRAGQETGAIAWPRLEWDLIGDELLFVYLWSWGVQQTQVSADRLLHCWLRAWYAVESRDHRLALKDFDLSHVDAQFAPESSKAAHDHGLASKALHARLVEQRRAQVAKQRRVQVIAMLRPEMGWSNAVVERILRLDNVRAFLSHPGTVDQIRALRAHALNQAGGRGVVGRLLAFVSPQALTELLGEARSMIGWLRDTLKELRDQTVRSPRIASWLESLEAVDEVLADSRGQKSSGYRSALGSAIEVTRQVESWLMQAESGLPDHLSRELCSAFELARGNLEPPFSLLVDAFWAQTWAFNELPGLCPSLAELRAAHSIPEADPLPPFDPRMT